MIMTLVGQGQRGTQSAVQAGRSSRTSRRRRTRNAGQRAIELRLEARRLAYGGTWLTYRTRQRRQAKSGHIGANQRRPEAVLKEESSTQF